MNELERRCIRAAYAVPLVRAGDGVFIENMSAIVSAVLAEAGVADLVGACMSMESLLTNYGLVGGPNSVVMKARAVIAKAIR